MKLEKLSALPIGTKLTRITVHQQAWGQCTRTLDVGPSLPTNTSKADDTIRPSSMAFQLSSSLVLGIHQQPVFLLCIRNLKDLQNQGTVPCDLAGRIDKQYTALQEPYSRPLLNTLLHCCDQNMHGSKHKTATFISAWRVTVHTSVPCSAVFIVLPWL